MTYDDKEDTLPTSREHDVQDDAKVVFTSDIFDSFSDMVAEQAIVETDSEKQRKRRDIVRNFTNGLSTMTEKEAEELGIGEITNHLTSYRHMAMRTARLVSTYTLTNRFAEIYVDSGNAEDDFVMSEVLTTAFNEEIVYDGTKFLHMMWQLAGEIQISGGVPIVFREADGVVPNVEMDMFFPASASLESEELPYAYTVRDLSLADLKHLRRSVKGKKGKIIDVEALDQCIEHLNAKLANKGVSTSTVSLSGSSVSNTSTTKSYLEISNGSIAAKKTLTVWRYYEVRHTDKGSHVSVTLFTYDVNHAPGQGQTQRQGAMLLAHIEKAFETPDMWMHHVAIDSEIGGVRNVSTLRGIADIMYSSTADIEELTNLILEGDKMRAKPRFQMAEGSDPDKVLAWNPTYESLVPNGVVPFDMRNSTSQLHAPLQLLQLNAAQIASGDVANASDRGGELRLQAKERQQNSGLMQSNDMNTFYTHMDKILAAMVKRALSMDFKPGSEGYNSVMRFRRALEKNSIPIKQLAESAYGKFLHIKVKANRLIGDGDASNMNDIADFLIENMSRISPALRPMLLQKVMSIRTRNPTLAAQLVQVPSLIINTQRLVAENEADTIARRSDLGEVIPLNPDDVHLDQIPIHIKDLVALVARHQSRPWDKSDVLTFAGMQEHVQLHLQAASEDPASAPDVEQMVPQYIEVVQMGQSIAQEVENSQGSEMSGLSPKEQAEIELKIQKQQLEAQKFGAQIESNKALERSRQARAAKTARKDHFNEVVTMRRLELEKLKTQKELQANIDATKQPPQQ